MVEKPLILRHPKEQPQTSFALGVCYYGSGVVEGRGMPGVYISHSTSPWELAQVYVLARETEVIKGLASQGILLEIQVLVMG